MLTRNEERQLIKTVTYKIEIFETLFKSEENEVSSS